MLLYDGERRSEVPWLQEGGVGEDCRWYGAEGCYEEPDTNDVGEPHIPTSQ